MASPPHEEQQRIWDEEHRNPTVLKQMDSSEASSGVERFWKFLEEQGTDTSLKGVEMGCGKGRNVIWLAREGVRAEGFDFSPAAIEEAKRRATLGGVFDLATFRVMDATKPWEYESASFDFGIDCFASTDIESPEGRAYAVAEFHRVLKPGGYLLAYLLSPDDEFHKEMLEKSPATEQNAFVHMTGKFEKTFDEEEIGELYKDFKVIRKERVPKTTQFFGKEYACSHFWLVLEKA